MKLSNKAFALSTMAIFALVFSFSLALAEDNGGEDISVSSQIKVGVNSTRASSDIENQNEDQNEGGEGVKENSRERSATSTLRAKDEDGDKEGVEATSTDKKDDGKDGEDNGAKHERQMSGVLKKLEKMGKEIPGLGDEIREIARNEASSTEERVAAIHEIQQQGFLSRFIFGSDRNKLKSLSEELKSTQKSIDRLTLAKAKIGSSTIEAQIDVQIKALETARTSAESFVKDNESTFSIFGFFSKIFGGK